MTEFTVFPAIDLREGRVVRLAQGDPDRQTTYADDPAAAARRWISTGARWLHVVNLDGAFGSGQEANLKALGQILDEALRKEVSVQFGGGIREQEDIRHLLDLGVSRVVLGTAAARDPGLVGQAVEAFGPQSIAVGVDVRGGKVQVKGWTEDADIDPLTFGRLVKNLGAVWAVHTDVSRDGVEAGLNTSAAGCFQKAAGLKVIGAGGVSSLEDIRKARRAGLHGAITGRAIYEGTLDFKRAVEAAGEEV